MSRRGLVGWDVDGTLLSSTSVQRKHAQALASLFGVSACERFALREIAEDADVHMTSSYRSIADVHSLMMLKDVESLQMIPGIIELVSELSLPSVVVTSGFSQVIRAVLGEQASLFAGFYGRELASKDDIFKCFERHSFIYVTDSTRDVDRCVANEFSCVAVGWGLDDELSLRNAGASAYCRDVESLRRCLTNLLT